MGGWKSKRRDNNTNKSDEDNDENDNDDNVTLLHFYLWNPWADLKEFEN